MTLVTGTLILTACSEADDYTAYTTPLLSEGAVVTGSSDVTATTATFHGTVAGLENANKASYATGFKYGYAENALTETVAAGSTASFSATIGGQTTNQVIYYQAFVTLQGRVTYSGEVKSLITTNAKAVTGQVVAVDYADVTLAGSASGYPDDAKVGIVIAASSDQEAVRAGLRLEAAEPAQEFIVIKQGLVPATTYYYAAFVDLGVGMVFGDVKTFTTSDYTIDVDEEFVDLGLSVKWAKRNIGAKKATDFGGFFGFGDLTGVNPSIDAGDYASADTYRTATDLVNVATGGKGTLPTADLFEELFRLSETQWTVEDGVAGYKVTGPNGNSIFLPAGGKRVASTLSDQGVRGYYLTGSVNPANASFAIDYEFNATTGVRATRAVYEALSLRPVSTARNVKFDKSLLCKTWHIDLRADGSHAHFAGPAYFMGTDDSWRTITNGEPVVGNSWTWEADYAGNSWVVGEDPRDFGTMTFTEDGKVTVTKIDAEGNSTTEEGTYTVDQANKTITLTVDILAVPAQAARGDNARTNLNILSLTDETLQLGMMIDGNTGQVSFNYASDLVYSGISVSLLAVGTDWAGTWGTPLTMLSPQDINGTHTVSYHGAVNGAMVTLVDFVGLTNKFPNAFVRIDELKLDGQPIKFDANKFFYGDIEDNGNFRVEMFNIWGKGAQDGVVVTSPFSNLTNAGGDDAFTFADNLEITFTVVTNGLGTTYTPCLITINPSWGGPWDYNQGASFTATLNSETGKYQISNADFDILYNSDIHADGSIMTFIEIADVRKLFPSMHAVLNWIKLDGNNVSFDASKVVDTNEDMKYRLELWNTYGATRAGGCGFGEPDGDVIHELGFTSSMELNFSIKNLFDVPQF